MNVANRIRLVRMHSGKSMRAFAKNLSPKASAVNVGRLERGTCVPTTATLRKLALGEGVSVQWMESGFFAPKTIQTTVQIPGVGARIEQARVAAGLSARKLAQMANLGTSAENVRRLETGRATPKLSTIQKLAVALRLPVHQLIYP